MTGRPTLEGERTALDADGNTLREWDGVVLLQALKPTALGNCEAMPAEIPAGTRATVIALLDGDDGRLDLECYLDEGGDLYAFAHGAASDVRVVERIEDKKTVEL